MSRGNPETQQSTPERGYALSVKHRKRIKEAINWANTVAA